MTVLETVALYYDAWQNKRGDFSEVPLAEDFEFVGPVASFDTAEGYRAMAAEAGQAVTSFAELPLVQIDSELIVSAIHRSRNSQLSFWDALIVQAAIEGHASTLYSEDMQHGQTLDSLRVLNPFS